MKIKDLKSLEVGTKVRVSFEVMIRKKGAERSTKKKFLDQHAFINSIDPNHSGNILFGFTFDPQCKFAKENKYLHNWDCNQASTRHKTNWNIDDSEIIEIKTGLDEKELIAEIINDFKL